MLIVHFKSSEIPVSRHQAVKVEAVEAEICCEDQDCAERARSALLALEPCQQLLSLSDTVREERTQAVHFSVAASSFSTCTQEVASLTPAFLQELHDTHAAKWSVPTAGGKKK
jgi:hypothetical protein